MVERICLPVCSGSEALPVLTSIGCAFSPSLLCATPWTAQKQEYRGLRAWGVRLNAAHWKGIAATWSSTAADAHQQLNIL